MRTAPSASRLQPSAPWTSPWATAQRRSGGPAARRAAPSRSRADRASRRAASIEWSPTHLQQCFRLHEHICRGAARGRRRERRGLDELQRLRRVPRRVCSPKRCDDVCSHGAARARSSCREAWSRVANWHMHFYVVVRPSIEWLPSLRLIDSVASATFRTDFCQSTPTKSNQRIPTSPKSGKLAVRHAGD